MKNSAGEELENRTAGAPVLYLHGAGKILPQLESKLLGLQTGDKRSIAVELPEPFFFEVEIAAIRWATAEELQSGEPSEKTCGPGCNC